MIRRLGAVAGGVDHALGGDLEERDENRRNHGGGDPDPRCAGDPEELPPAGGGTGSYGNALGFEPLLHALRER